MGRDTTLINLKQSSSGSGSDSGTNLMRGKCIIHQILPIYTPHAFLADASSLVESSNEFHTSLTKCRSAELMKSTTMPKRGTRARLIKYSRMSPLVSAIADESFKIDCTVSMIETKADASSDVLKSEGIEVGGTCCCKRTCQLKISDGVKLRVPVTSNVPLVPSSIPKLD